MPSRPAALLSALVSLAAGGLGIAAIAAGDEPPAPGAPTVQTTLQCPAGQGSVTVTSDHELTPEEQAQVVKDNCAGTTSGPAPAVSPVDTAAPKPSSSRCPSTVEYETTGKGDLTYGNGLIAGRYLRTVMAVEIPAGVGLTIRHRGITWTAKAQKSAWHLAAVCSAYHADALALAWRILDHGSISVRTDGDNFRDAHTATAEAIINPQTRGKIRYTLARHDGATYLSVADGAEAVILSPALDIKGAVCTAGRRLKITRKDGIRPG
jgi:hypothetical protein